MGKKFAGGKTPDTFREEHVVWGGGNTGKVTDGAAVEKSWKVRLKENYGRLRMLGWELNSITKGECLMIF